MIGCFVLGNPLLPVYRGDSQCVSLGLDVKALGDDGLARWARVSCRLHEAVSVATRGRVRR